MRRFRGPGKTGVTGEKPLGARERTNNKLNPHMAAECAPKHSILVFVACIGGIIKKLVNW